MKATVAQSGERGIEGLEVTGSNPVGGVVFCFAIYIDFFCVFVRPVQT